METDKPYVLAAQDSSDAGTVVENSLNEEYAEPDHFGVVETYQT